MPLVSCELKTKAKGRTFFYIVWYTPNSASLFVAVGWWFYSNFIHNPQIKCFLLDKSKHKIEMFKIYSELLAKSDAICFVNKSQRLLNILEMLKTPNENSKY